jgi:amino acid adenylation domain-containing protein
MPASFSQEALWFLDCLDPGRPTFNVSAAVRVVGPLDVPSLSRALAEIVRRHEALRTTFAIEGERPVQIITPADAFPIAFELTDLSRVPEPDRRAEAARRSEAAARRPFDLARGPLVRGEVLKLSDTEHAVILTMHHIVTDGWSFGVAARELAVLYQAFRDDRPSPIPEPQIQYVDYAVWQRERLTGPFLESLLTYWTERLAGVPALDLPTDRPRPATRSGRGRLRPFCVPDGLSAAVRALGRAEGATPFMTLLAAFQALLCRHSGQRDFAVGTPVANRCRPEVEGLIGYFINMLVLRANLSCDPSFRELLSRVRRDALSAFDYQDLPFERLVEALQPSRDPSRTPLFQVMFVFQNNEKPDVRRSDLELFALEPAEGMGGGTGTSKFDLTLAMSDSDDGRGMVGSFEYDADLFSAETVDRLTERFLALLDSVTSDPSRHVSELSILSEPERTQVVEEWNRTDIEVSPGLRVHHLFEAQAARTPEAVAVEGAGRILTYAGLDGAANRLAHLLIGRGIGPDVRVAIALDRSPEMAVAVLGVLKAGGAYVPLDPEYPRDRLALMLDDARPALLITRLTLSTNLPVTRVEVLHLDSELTACAAQPSTTPDVATESENVAYVIYTSGSTGSPRGVEVTHGGLANHALAASRLFSLTPDDRVLQFASFSFDIAVEEIFPAWSRGATVVLRGGDETLEPLAFSEWIRRRGITFLDLPTAYWHTWVNRLSARGGRLPESLRLVVVGGERALPAVYERWRSIGGDRVRWLNTYGPTETTVIATSDEPPIGEGANDLPIGRPIANTKVYLLDNALRPVPTGVPGEVFIGGAGVARGYLGRPSATALRILPDPFTTRPGARMFRTGDRARWRHDGRIEFQGRVDDQVKVSGQRVEPGEVEAALLTHPAVAQAAVVARLDPGGEGRLDAYLVADPSATTDELRRFLRDRLPRPMIPRSFTRLDALPMSPSGKVDRRSLPPPDRSAMASDRDEAVIAPSDDVERRLVGLWEEVLDQGPIGVNENFFELGGHSLLAIRLLARIEDEFGRPLGLPELFLGPTVGEMAARLRQVAPQTEGEWSPLVAIQASGAGRPFFCVHPAGGIVYCFHELARRIGTDRPFYALQSPGLEEGQEPFSTLEEMASRYVLAVREHQPTGPYHLGGWSLGGVVAYEMARQIEASGESVATLALLDTWAPSGRAPVVPRALREIAREVADLGIFDEEAGRRDEVDDALVLAEFAGGLTRRFGGDARRLIDHLRQLSPEARRAHLLRELGLDRVYSLHTGPERVGRLWTVLRANLLAGIRYTPGPYGGCVVLFRASDDERPTDPALGWSKLARVVTTHTVPGDHAGILKAPGVSVLAAGLRDELQRSDRGEL